VTWTDVPLTAATVVTSWRWDASVVLVTAAVAAAYLRGYLTARRRGSAVPPGRAICLLTMGTGVWLLTGISMIGVYSSTLFWVRALQALLLMYVVPFGLAAGMPLTVLRDALGATGRARLDAALASGVARALTFPAVGSALMLVTPWLLFLSPWLTAVLRHGPVDALTRLLLVAIGFLYFYARLQADPVPRRFNQSVSLLITVVESLADGVLGIVLWLGPLVAAGYYDTVARTWGPSPRTDQIIGAGVFWILGDVLGLPFLLSLMRAFSADERRKAAEIDAELDAAQRVRPSSAENTEDEPSGGVPMMSGLWWENDPQLRERFNRR
jgi:cytochrome c oxidase assembly factor CtaG